MYRTLVPVASAALLVGAAACSDDSDDGRGQEVTSELQEQGLPAGDLEPGWEIIEGSPAPPLWFGESVWGSDSNGTVEFVRDAARDGVAAHEVELNLFRRVMALGRNLLGTF
jgi:hypothetical protein